MNNPNAMFSLFQGAICLYVLYCGITGSGSAYKDDNVHKDYKELYKKRMRQFCLIGGAVGLIGAALEFFSYEGGAATSLTTVALIISGVFFVLVVIMGVYCYRWSDQSVKRRRKKAEANKK